MERKGAGAQRERCGTQRRKERDVFSAKVALAEVMWVFPRRPLSFLRAASCHSCARPAVIPARGLPSFPRARLSFLRGLPSFLRRRESVWYGGECESVGYDVGIPARPAVIPVRGLPSFPRRRESGWYGGECESVGYDVSVGMTEGGAY